MKQLVTARTAERDASKVERDVVAAERDVALAERDAAKVGLINKTLEAEKLKFELARLKRMTFGASSERIKREIEQLELKLEELESDAAQDASTASSEPTPDEKAAEAREKKGRRSLPEHLPRTTTTHEPASPTCATCGSDRLRKVGEDVTEILEYVPDRFEVVRHVRPAYSCRTCEAMMQAPMPALPILRGQAGPGLLAHIAIGKYCDHVPLYRQAEIYARDGVDLDRATLADWVGRIAWLVWPLADRIGEHVMAGSVIHADDTPIPVLAPGNGKTKTGRLWVYLRDERPHAGPAPPAVLYRYTPDRKGEHCRAHLDPFGGHLHAEEFAPGVCPARDLDDGGRHALGALVELLESSVPVGAIRYARSRWDALTRYDRRASDQQDRRATALEYRSTGDAKRRRLTSPLSSR